MCFSDLWAGNGPAKSSPSQCWVPASWTRGGLQRGLTVWCSQTAPQPSLSAVGPCSWTMVTENPRCFPSLRQCSVPPPLQTSPAAVGTQHRPHGAGLAGVACIFCWTREGRWRMREHSMGMRMGGHSPPIPLRLPGGLSAAGRACLLLPSFGGRWEASPRTPQLHALRSALSLLLAHPGKVSQTLQDRDRQE